MPKHANTATNDTIYSAEVGNNSDLFPDILRLYVPDGARILDCTYGKGTFWRKVVESKYELDFTDAWMGSDAATSTFTELLNLTLSFLTRLTRTTAPPSGVPSIAIGSVKPRRRAGTRQCLTSTCEQLGSITEYSGSVEFIS